MATVEVSTWAELAEALNRAEDTDIYIAKDIDLNNELPEGISTSFGNGSYKKTIYGNGHSVINIRCTADTTQVFKGGSTNRLKVYNTKLLNCSISGNQSYLAAYTDFYDSIILTDVVMGSYSIGPAVVFSGTFTRCGVTINGYNYVKVTLNGTSTATQTFTDCNVKLIGTFAFCYFNLQNSWLTGSFESDNSYDVVFNNSFGSFINAAIKTNKKITATSAALTVINTDLLDDFVVSALPTTLTQCTTEEIISAPFLRYDKNFPIGVDS